MKKELKPMTDDEKRLLFLTVAPADIHHEVDSWSHGEGVSFFINDQWAGGMAFLENTNLLVGGMKQEYLTQGLWADAWAEAITWAHTIHREIVMQCKDESIADMFMKAGGKEKQYRENNGEQYCQVWFSKDYTENFLQNNTIGRT